MSQYYELSPNLQYSNENIYYESSSLDTNYNSNNKLINVREYLVDLLKNKFEYDYEELPELELIEKLIKEFNIINKTYISLHTKLHESIKKTEYEVRLINSHMKYIMDMNKQYDNTNNTNDLFGNIKQDIENLSDKIKNNNDLENIREKYNDTRKKMLSYLSFIKKINNFNTGSTCSLCLSNNVNMFFDPCGHTSCQECINKLEVERGDVPCPFCKKKIKISRPLYFI